MYEDECAQRLMVHRQCVGSRRKPHIACYAKGVWGCWNYGPGTGSGATPQEAYASWVDKSGAAVGSQWWHMFGQIFVPLDAA